MRQPRSFLFHIFIFVLAQVAWLILLGLWIYWYITNYMVISEVGAKISSRLMSEGFNHLVLVGGLVLLIAVSTGMSLIFHRLSVQYKLTRLYDNFIANVTHELKSPLTSMQLYLETMHMHDLPRERQEEFIAMMLKDTHRLYNLISAILQIPALEQKKIAHDFQVQHMGELVPELVREARDQFNLPQEALSIAGDGNCKCLVDRNALRIVLDNLIDNSIKYTETQVSILITMHCQRGHFSLVYTDHGVGIPAQEHKKVFQKFYRSQNENMPNVKGTGLGLYWVKEIVSLHRGTIRAEQRNDGHGARFVLQLPRHTRMRRRSLRNIFRTGPHRQQRRTQADNG